MEFPELLRKNKVKMLLNKDLNFLHEDASLSEVIESIRNKQVSYCVIMDKKSNKILGLVTEPDLLNFAGGGKFDGKKKISEFLGKYTEYITVPSNKSIASVVKLMYRSGFRNIVVTHETDEKIIEGVVSVRDFISYLIEFFPETVFNVNLKPTTENREGA